MPLEKPSREIATILHRVGTLSAGDQLRAYELIRDYVKAGQKIVTDPELDDRAVSLKALEAVVEHLKLDDASKIEVKQFDAAPAELRDGWSSARIIRAWGKWSFAQRALAGSKTRATARQRSIRKASGVSSLTSDDYLAAIKTWLATDPPDETTRSYMRWRGEMNLERSPGTLPYPSIGAIRRGLRRKWEDCLLIAKGKKTLASTPQSADKVQLAVVRGPDDLVSFRDIKEMTGSYDSKLWQELLAPGAPVPVVTASHVRMWLREDIEAWVAGKPFPERTENELQHRYMTPGEVAEHFGLTPGGIKYVNRMPKPAAVVGQRRLWLRSEIEAHHRWEQENPGKAARRGPKRAKKSG